MGHDCEIPKTKGTRTLRQKARDIFQELITVSSRNPCHFNFFKSELSVRNEKERHLKTNPYAIHPYSPFRGAYEVCLVVLYTNVLILKPMWAFLHRRHYGNDYVYKEFTIVMDLLCWVDIVFTFFCGFLRQTQQYNIIELQFSKIAKNYVFGPYFICDVLSSVPKGIMFYPPIQGRISNLKMVNLVFDVLMLLKIVRIVPLFGYIYNSLDYFGVISKSVPFFTCLYLLTILTVHWAACFQYGVSRVVVLYTPSVKNQTWIYKNKISMKNILGRYNHAFCRASAYILGIRQSLYDVTLNEEYLINVVTYFIGKILVAVNWLVLAMAILNSRSVHIKFLELKNQLEEYMKRKKLPDNVSRRISKYYNYKYQKKYFKEDVIKSLLPENIKRDVNMHVCKTMISSVTIFSDLTHQEISTMVDHLIPEIFLPRDTIIQHGTYGDAMYFLFSGTVAVYTRSGKEICHLQDGAYFGEISLLIPEQARTASIVAVETSRVYRLNKMDFDRCLVKNRNVLTKVMRRAEERLKEAKEVETTYKNQLFTKEFRVADFHDD